MRAYAVTAQPDGYPTRLRYVGSQDEASKLRQAWMKELGLKLRVISIDTVDIPSTKPDLLAYLNAIVKRYDA